MPVEDHAVHESVKIAADKRYGCWGKGKQSVGYYAKDRAYRGNGTFSEQLVFIHHVMTTDCRYDLHTTDPRCTDCPATKRFT
jgi:hypothetical protein